MFNAHSITRALCGGARSGVEPLFTGWEQNAAAGLKALLGRGSAPYCRLPSSELAEGRPHSHIFFHCWQSRSWGLLDRLGGGERGTLHVRCLGGAAAKARQKALPADRQRAQRHLCADRPRCRLCFGSAIPLNYLVLLLTMCPPAQGGVERAEAHCVCVRVPVSCPPVQPLLSAPPPTPQRAAASDAVPKESGNCLLFILIAS